MIALDERGKDLTTVALAESLTGWQQEGGDIAFVIGGADGLDPALKAKARTLIRLSSLTLPHGMVRVLLADDHVLVRAGIRALLDTMDDIEVIGETGDGRAAEARKHLRSMATGDLALYYHTGDERSVVGTAVVKREAFPDPTSPKGEDWSAVEVAPKGAFASPVSLAAMKAAPELKGLLLITRGRLSVMPVSSEHFDRIARLGSKKLKRGGA